MNDEYFERSHLKCLSNKELSAGVNSVNDTSKGESSINNR